MTSNRNPCSCAQLQALLDIDGRGGFSNMTFSQVIKKITEDKKLQDDLQKQWNSHLYPDRDMVYAQITITPALQKLSPRALKVLVYLGSYTSQSTLIKISYPVLEVVTGIKRTMLREAVKELEDNGIIYVRVKPARHEAPIYSVNPTIFNKGTRSKVKENDYLRKLVATGFNKSDMLSTGETDTGHSIKCETVRGFDANGEKITYNHITIEPKNPEPTTKEDPGKRTGTRRFHHNNHTTSDDGEQIPGQFEIADFPEALPF